MSHDNLKGGLVFFFLFFRCILVKVIALAMFIDKHMILPSQSRPNLSQIFAIQRVSFFCLTHSQSIFGYLLSDISQQASLIPYSHYELQIFPLCPVTPSADLPMTLSIDSYTGYQSHCTEIFSLDLKFFNVGLISFIYQFKIHYCLLCARDWPRSRRYNQDKNPCPYKAYILVKTDGDIKCLYVWQQGAGIDFQMGEPEKESLGRWYLRAS